MSSTRGLHPSFKPYADAWVALLRSFDPRFVVTSGLRSFQDQARLRARFEAREPGLFTVLPPGRSQHERGFALDIARVGHPAATDALLREAGHLWRSLGGVWGGEADPVHFEAPKSMTGRG